MTKPSGSSTSTRAIGAGLTLAASVGLLAWLGLWLDRRCDTLPLFLLIGVLWGVVGGILHLIRVLAPELLPFGRRSGPPPSQSPRGGKSRKP